MHKEIYFSGRYTKEVMQTIWLVYYPFRWKILSAVLIGFIGRILLLGNANVIGHWVDELGKGSADSSQYIFILLVMSTIGFLFNWIFRLQFSSRSAQAVSHLYDELTYRVSRYPQSFFDRTPTGVVITRFSSDYGNVFRLFGGPLAEFISIIFDLVAMLILVTLASAYFLPVLAMMVVMDYLIYRLNRNKLRSARRELSASRSPSVAHFAETAQGSSTIRVFNKESIFTDRFSYLDNLFLKKKLKSFGLLTFFSGQMSVLTAGLLLSIGFLSIYLVQHQWISAGSVGVAFGFVALSGNSIHMFFEWLAQFEEAMTGMERLDHYLRLPIEPGALLPTHSTIPTGQLKQESPLVPLPDSGAAEVEVEDLWFRYSEDLPFVLKGINFKIQPGERLGIVGRTGSGKSSLTQCLFYLYPIHKGHIKINGYKPNFLAGGIDLENYRNLISFIAQDPTLFQGTVQQNLDISGQLPEESLIASLHQVGLEELAHPTGLRFNIEEKGRNLSAGEKQLLCMARCLLQDSPLVILDEATSSVDPQSERKMSEAIEVLFNGRTQIIIAHRLSTLEKCDRILWIHDGEVQMLGTPSEVLPIFQKSSLSFHPAVVKPGHERGQA